METQLMLASRSRIHEIDGLRGIAILSVIIFHYFIFPFTPFLSKIGLRGVLMLLAYGVDLFFVISGYLIGSILLKVEGLSGVGTFYLRRILRIWPLYYLLLFLVYSALPDKSMLSNAPYWSFPFFIFNFWESHGNRIHQALGPLWSIAVEEQFYAIGPIIFLALNRKQISFILVIFTLLSPLLRLVLIYKTDIDIWRFTPARIDGICIGLLLSIFLSSTKNVLFVTKRINYFTHFMYLLLVSLIPSIAIISNTLWVSFGHSLVVLTFGCVLLVVQVRCFSGQKVRFLNWNILRYLGLRCYSIYLFHIFFIFIARTIYDDFIIDIVIASLLNLLFAHLSWRYIETPFIKLGQKFSYDHGAR